MLLVEIRYLKTRKKIVLLFKHLFAVADTTRRLKADRMMLLVSDDS